MQRGVAWIQILKIDIFTAITRLNYVSLAREEIHFAIHSVALIYKSYITLESDIEN